MILLGRRHWRTSWLIVTLLCSILFLFTTSWPLDAAAYYLSSYSTNNSPALTLASRIGYERTQIISSERLTAQAAFVGPFYSVVHDNRPQCEPLTHPEETHLDVGFASDEAKERPDLLRMTRKQKKALKKAHRHFVKEVKSVEHVLPYAPGTRGIVTTAGGSYLPVMVTSLRMIRESGSQLPMEIFLATDLEYEPEFCDKILPALNATCVILQDIFDAANTPVKLNKYQFKIVSIILSSFDDVLFLDSDAFSIYNPDTLFDSEPFASTGLVLWPDFWFPSESPLYFDIADIEAPSINERAAAESGELMYSKSKHEHSLMLAAYYNYYGPDFYYPLLSQGAPGEGDKDTFVWAATAMHEPYYFVHNRVRAIGYVDKAGDWRGSAMIQADPVQDHNRSMSRSSKNSTSSSSEEKDIPPFFVHANHPKFDPATIFNDWAMDAPTPTRDADGTWRRAWNNDAGSGISEEDLGFDLERRFWSQILITACLGENKFTAWRGYEHICDRIAGYWRDVILAGDQGGDKPPESW